MNLDEQLDERLRDATPPIAVRTAELRREMEALVVDATPVARRPRRSSRAALVAVTALGALGAGTAAAAAGLIPGWSIVTGSGQTCHVELVADLPRAGDGEPSAGTEFDETERAEAVAAARSFLHGFDYVAIDRDAAITRWQAAEDAAIAAQPDPAERQPALTGDDLEVTALTFEVTARLRDHLAGRGLDLRAVSLATTTSGCDL